ncbi:MAG: TonB-dependent receptor [Sphingopyxis sp.]|uniref:TonB-dependent receptor n=1 Tax=Sphingopyxis sp. TaxID=1908224 RepID=UPI002ABB6959|nr:TonB-dependent receptor [Sphingopyxis sp.]MDZ3832671.1 TonB-dependent receptor [Sphingopyxis sp.]
MKNSDRGAVQAVAAASPSALLALGCFGLMAGASPAMAQEEPRLGGVTVTDTAIDDSYARSETQSDKATAALVDTPQTVSVVSQELIRDRGARTLAEVLRNTPGISFDAGENGFGTSTNNFTLRGFDSSGSVFVDNARDSGSYARDVFNIDSVEVVKGAAADNGRGNAGGYVNINTKKPLLDAFVAGDISLGFDQYGSRARKRGAIDVNQPLGGTAAIRLNAVVEDSGVPGRDLARNKLWGFAPSIAVGLGTNLRATLSWEHVERDDRPDWGVPGATIRGLFRHDPAAERAPRDAYYGLRSDFDDATSDAVLGRLEYEPFTGFVVANQTRWSRVDRRARFTIPRAFVAPSTATSSTLFYDRENESLTNLTSLNAQFSTGALRHSVAAGVELSWEKSNALRFGLATPADTDIFNPDPERSGAAAFSPTQRARADIETFAVYLFDTISIGDRFQITAGVRGEGYRVELDSRELDGTPTGAFDNFRQSPFTWSGKVGLTWKPVENASLYASFGTSTLPPGSYLSNSDASRTGDNVFPGLIAGAKPVRSHNYEVGAKVDLLDGGLSLTLAGFRGEKRNVPVVGRPAATGSNSLQGYQKLVVEGVEFGVSGQVTPDWNIFGGVLVMDSKRKLSDAMEAALGFGNSGDYSAAFPASGLNGDRLAFTPNVSATLWTTYRLPFGLTVGGGVQHAGSSYLGRPDDALRVIPNGFYGKLPAYTLVNAMLSYDVTDAINLRLNIDNIANEKYALTTNWNGTRASLGAPRTYLISAGFRF